MGSAIGDNKDEIITEYEAVNYATQDGMIIISSIGNNGESSTQLNYYEFPSAIDRVIAVGGVEPTCDKEEIWYDNYTGVIDPNGRRGTSTWLVSTILNNPDTTYERCSFSTANDSIFVCAPGTRIITEPSASMNEAVSRSWFPGTGTSFAAPIVTSAAIGVKQMRPYVDTDMFKEILKATSVDLDEPGYC